MRRSKIPFTLAAEALQAESPQGELTHPAHERLLAYHNRRLNPDEKEEMQDHLALCPQCARAILDLATQDSPDPSVVSTPFQRRKAWKALRRRIRKSQARDAASRRRSSRSTLEKSNHFALAACLAAACLGLALWAVWLKLELHRLAQPHLAPQVLELHLENDPKRSFESTVRTVSAQDAINLLVWVNDLENEGPFRFEIRRRPVRLHPEPVWSDSSNVRNPLGYVSLTLRAGYLEPGDYALSVFDSRLRPISPTAANLRVIP